MKKGTKDTKGKIFFVTRLGFQTRRDAPLTYLEQSQNDKDRATEMYGA